MRKWGWVVVVVLCGAWSARGFAAPPTRSVYTHLSENCQRKVYEEDDGVDTAFTCPGVEGYVLRHGQFDLQEDLEILHQGRTTDLNLSSHIADSMTTLSDKAEWRLMGNQPIALIVQMMIGHPAKQALIVSRIEPAPPCVVEVIDATKIKNGVQLARQAADESAKAPCLWTDHSPTKPIFPTPDE